MLDIKKLLTKLVQSSEKTKNVSWMCCGAVSGISVNANSYTDVAITFPSTAPTNAPRVIAMLRATSTSQNRSLLVPVHAAYSSTGSTIRVFNNSSTNLSSLVFNWIAME